MASKHNWVGGSCLDSEIQSGGCNGTCGRENLRDPDAGDEDEFSAEWELASPHADSVNAWPGEAGERPEKLRPHGDPKKWNEALDARSELRNAWHDA